MTESLDDNFEVFNQYKSKCADCKHFDLINISCKAFGNKIKREFLTGVSVHNKVIKGQDGKYVFTPFSS